MNKTLIIILKQFLWVLCFAVCSLHAHATTSAEELISKIEGVYKKQFPNGTEQGEKYTSENILEIVPFEKDKIYFVIRTAFYNGHSCGVEGIAQYEDFGRFVFNTKRYNGEQCRLSISLKKDVISIEDKDSVCRKEYCGNRGILDDERSFTLDKRRTIRYMQRILDSRHYKAAIEAFKKQESQASNKTDILLSQTAETESQVKNKRRFMDEYYNRENPVNSKIQIFEKKQANCDLLHGICTISRYEIEKHEDSKINELMLTLLKKKAITTLENSIFFNPNQGIIDRINSAKNINDLLTITYSGLTTMTKSSEKYPPEKIKYGLSAGTFESKPGIIGIQIDSLWWSGGHTHVNSEFHIYSKATLEALDPKKVFNEDELQKIIKLADNKFETMLNSNGFDYNRMNQEKFSELVFKNMKIMPKGIDIEFPRYIIACGAASNPMITIEYDELK